MTVSELINQLQRALDAAQQRRIDAESVEVVFEFVDPYDEKVTQPVETVEIERDRAGVRVVLRSE